MTPSRDISRLLEIMAALRTPVTGCPWDLEQNFATIAPYTVEEAYEVVDAIARDDFDDLRDELGDLLLQVVYHAQMAEERNAFAFCDVVEAITRKMIRRHPHVFADRDGNIEPAGVKSAWERIKAEEKAERAARRSPQAVEHKSLLSSVKAGQPALTRAMELQRKASTVGFDWNDPRAVLQKKLRIQPVPLRKAPAHELESTPRAPQPRCWKGGSLASATPDTAAAAPGYFATAAASPTGTPLRSEITLLLCDHDYCNAKGL